MLEKPRTTAETADAGTTAVLDAPVAGATDVVEAATTEAAIAEVHRRLGPDARIFDARRVLRGGIGGFFAKEHVQLHAAPGEQAAAGATVATAGPAVSPSSGPATPTASGSSTPTASGPGTPASSAPARPTPRVGGVNPWAQVAADDAAALSPVDRLLARADEVPDEGPSAIDFATFLRSQLGQDDAPAATTGAAAVAGTAGTAEDRVIGHVEPTAANKPASTDADQLDRPAWPRIEIDPSRIVGGRAVHLDADGEIAEPMDAAAGEAADAAPTPTSPPVAAPVAAAPAAEVAMPGTSTSDPLTREPVPATDGGPAWSVPTLLALGLPVELVRSLEVDAPHDDIAWTMALAESLRPSCRPLPDGPAVFVGPCADGFAQVDEAPVARSETWLAALRPGRWIHLVVGGADWRRGLAESPLAVSWAEPDDLPDAIRCAVELGLVLGYGPAGAAMRRARPLDVALAVRELVVNR